MAQLMDVHQIFVIASKVGVIAEAAFRDAKLAEIVFTESDLEAIKPRAFMVSKSFILALLTNPLL